MVGAAADGVDAQLVRELHQAAGVEPEAAVLAGLGRLHELVAERAVDVAPVDAVDEVVRHRARALGGGLVRVADQEPQEADEVVAVREHRHAVRLRQRRIARVGADDDLRLAVVHPVLGLDAGHQPLAERRLDVLGAAHHLVPAGELVEEHGVAGVAGPVAPARPRQLVPLVAVGGHHHRVAHGRRPAPPGPVEVEDLVRMAGVARVLVHLPALRVPPGLQQAVREGARPRGVVLPDRVDLPVDAVVADRPEQGVADEVVRVRRAGVDHPPLAAVLVVEDRGVGVPQVVRV